MSGRHQPDVVAHVRYVPFLVFKPSSQILINVCSRALDMINIFEVFLPQLLRYPNPNDPLNGEAAALLMRHPKEYDAKVKGTCAARLRTPPLTLTQRRVRAALRDEGGRGRGDGQGRRGRRGRGDERHWQHQRRRRRVHEVVSVGVSVVRSASARH